MCLAKQCVDCLDNYSMSITSTMYWNALPHFISKVFLGINQSFSTLDLFIVNEVLVMSSSPTFDLYLFFFLSIYLSGCNSFIAPLIA